MGIAPNPAPSVAAAPSDKAFEFRHPTYTENAGLWQYFLDHYEGGPMYPMKTNPLPSPSTLNPNAPTEAQKSISGGMNYYIWRWTVERTPTYNSRLARAVYVNFIRPVVDLYVSTIGKPEHVLYKPTPAFEEFTKNADRCGMTLQKVMDRARRNAFVRGHTFLLVDSPPATQPLVTQADALAQKIRPYVVEILPENLLNWRLGDDGKPAEIMFRVRQEVNGSILDQESESGFSEEMHYWTNTEIQVWGKIQGHYQMIRGPFPNRLGWVPLLPLYFQHREPMLGDSLLRDSAKIAHLLTNWLSTFDQAIVSQMFAQLVLKSRKEPTDLAVGVAAVIHLNPSDGDDLYYVAPETAPFEAGWESFFRMLQMAMHQMGVKNSATAITDAVAQQSGVSKAWDFSETEKLLSNMATEEQQTVEHVYEAAGDWLGVPWDGVVQYSTKFDLSTLADDIANLIQLQTARAPIAIQQEYLRRIAVKAFPQVEDDIRKLINAQIEEMAAKMAAMADLQAAATAAKPPLPAVAPLQEAADMGGIQ